MAKKDLRLVTPTTVLRTVSPKRPPNPDLRTREHLTEAEVERLIKSVNRKRHSHRDATMVLVAYRHGLRVSELVDLRWEQVDFRTASLHVRRAKQGTPSTHPIVGDKRVLSDVGRCKHTSVTRISSTRCAIPSCRRLDSRISGGSEQQAADRLLLRAAAFAAWTLKSPWQTVGAFA
jgi:integrase